MADSSYQVFDPAAGVWRTLRLVDNGDGTFSVRLNTEGGKATYGLQASALALAGAGVFFQLQGSATKTVRILRASITGTLTTGASGDILLFKSTAAASGGSPVVGSLGSGGIAKHDSLDAGATAVPTVWSTPPSGAGTPVGGFRGKKVFFAAPSALGSPADWDFANRNGKGLVLRGASEFLMFYASTFASYVGASIDLDLEWTEE